MCVPLNCGGDPLKGDIKLPIKTFATIYLTEELKRKKVFVVLRGLSHEIDLINLVTNKKQGNPD
jgi:hypothetical protein